MLDGQTVENACYHRIKDGAIIKLKRENTKQQFLLDTKPQNGQRVEGRLFCFHKKDNRKQENNGHMNGDACDKINNLFHIVCLLSSFLF
jgi:GTP-dependent phosphoenolpyruvate carboxykinase